MGIIGIMPVICISAAAIALWLVFIAFMRNRGC
jgi:hypothetical protein